MGDTNGRAERDPRITRLYRDAAREEPPARLDAAILAAARREVGAGPRSLASKLRRWHVPISIAAVVVVSVSLVILVQQEELTLQGERAVEALRAPAEQPAAPPALSKVAKDPMKGAPEDSLSARPIPRADSEAADRSETTARRQLDAAAPASPGAGDVATPAGKTSPQPFRAAPSAGMEERVTHPAEKEVTAGRAASAPAASSEPRAALPRAEARRSAPVAGALAMKSIEQDRASVWRDYEKEPPEKWLARIEELKLQGWGAEAQEMLAEFRRRFPEYPLPSSLR